MIAATTQAAPRRVNVRCPDHGGHLQAAISLVTGGRDDAEAVARQEFETMSDEKRRALVQAVNEDVRRAMLLAAGMIARTADLLDEDVNVDAVAKLGAALATSGLTQPVIRMMTGGNE